MQKNIKNAWSLTLVASAIGAAILLLWLGGAKDAAQQAAIAGIAVAFAVIPYCFTRALAELNKLKQGNTERSE